MGIRQKLSVTVLTLLLTGIQASGCALLESGQGYDQKKVIGFMKNWTASAVVPKK